MTGPVVYPSLEWTTESWPNRHYSPYSHGTVLTLSMNVLRALLTPCPRDCSPTFGGADLVYDVANRESFEAMKAYHSNFCLERTLERPEARSAGYCYHDCAPRPAFKGILFVIANNIEIDRADRDVTLREVLDFCDRIGAILMRMSGRTGQGAGTEAAARMAYRILYRRIENGALSEDCAQSLPLSKAERRAANDLYNY
jgi:hypothetical protein